VLAKTQFGCDFVVRLSFTEKWSDALEASRYMVG
jgi:hypothetical protein